MKTVILFCLWLSCAVYAESQPFTDTTFKHYSFETKALGQVAIHVAGVEPGKKKPLLVYLDGSGNYPIYYRNSNKRISGSLAISPRAFKQEFMILVISKPGTPFFDTLSYSPSGRPYYPENEQYRTLYSLDWRAGAASEAIDYAIKRFNVDRTTIVAMGHSEGSQVAPRVAVINKKVTHVVCMAGNALTQLYDFILNARMQAEKGEITREEGQRIADSLYTVYEAIHSDPKSADQRWYGASYLKWASFSNSAPLDNMLALNIPILYVAGGRDNNQTILGMDYAKLEFIRRGKRNLTYQVYPDCDHFFQERKTVNGQIQNTDRLDEVFNKAVEWVKKSSRP
jgi:pimeloyl-ACP methyl ester carboxylesterase